MAFLDLDDELAALGYAEGPTQGGAPNIRSLLPVPPDVWRSNRAGNNCGFCGVVRADQGRATCGDCRSSQRALYRGRIERGLCGCCGEPSEPTRSKCRQCAVIHSDYLKWRTRTRLDNRQCVDCTAPSVTRLCEACLSRYRERWRVRKYGAGKTCADCRVPLPYDQSRVCEKCLALRASANRARRRMALRSAGLCEQCGVNPNPGPFSQCGDCLARKRASSIMSRSSDRIALGLCVGCLKRPKRVDSLCGHCNRRKLKNSLAQPIQSHIVIKQH